MYEGSRDAHALVAGGSYRILRERMAQIALTPAIEDKARELTIALSALPSPYIVEEVGWDGEMDLGEFQW